jgi:peptidoglycan/xylan/chitin deacetylase (PgdA/CDA1 family)
MAATTLPIIAASKMAVALWSMDSMDYRQIPASQVVERVKTLQPGAGDILLFHDDRAHTAEALDEVLNYLEDRGLASVTLEALMGRK